MTSSTVPFILISVCRSYFGGPVCALNSPLRASTRVATGKKILFRQLDAPGLARTKHGFLLERNNQKPNQLSASPFALGKISANS